MGSKKLKGVLFDMDGTVVDAPYDWPRIKAELGTQGVPILTYLSSLEEPERSRKWGRLQKYEDEATRAAVLKKGMRGFLDFLTATGVKKALITNNSRANVDILLKKFGLAFDCLISRESGLWKPSGAPLICAMRQLKLRKEECCAVGDSHFDIKAAEDAGISRIFILNKDSHGFPAGSAEIVPDVGSLHKKILSLI
jgi:HAD superfamily hydrolase (TIGR01549 family)